jgi:hypothetical protein
VDHPARGHLAGGGLDGIAELDRRRPVGLLLNLRAARPGDRPRDPAAVPKLRVGGVRDRVDLELGDVGALHLDFGHLLLLPGALGNSPGL